MSLDFLAGGRLAMQPQTPALRVALVNSMADAALAITEQRFARLLRAAFPNRTIDLRCVTPPQIARGEMAAARIAKHYFCAGDLFAAPPDAVIFSGAEPRAENLRGEAFWPFLVALFDWARAEKIPALFSCLAAHAAVLHFSGIPRHRLDRKFFGVFAHCPTAPHALLHGLPRSLGVAHSRWNELRAADLEQGGYEVLTEAGGGVDMFVPKDNANLLFLQGHPEYEPTALEGEYRRDLRRFLNGEVAERPDLPSYSASGQAEPGEGAARAPTPADFAPIIRNFVATRLEMRA